MSQLKIDYIGASVSVREDLRETHAAMLEHLRRPGSWFSGAERMAMAAESRAASACDLCLERKSSLSPEHPKGEHTRVSDLPEAWVEIVHRIRVDPQRLSRRWFDGVIASGLAEGPYVELVGVVTFTAGLDYFCRALGAAPLPLPEPAAGEPSGYRPENLRGGMAWVSMLAPEDAAGPEADLYESEVVPNIARALSLVPDHVRVLQQERTSHYVAMSDIGNPLVRRDLDRLQMELVASRISAMNECFYWTSAHAMLLRVSGQMTGTTVDMTAVNGEVHAETGVAHAAELVAFSEAVMRNDDGALEKARKALRAVLSDEAFVDTCALVGAFNVVDRIADSTGIPLDDPIAMMTAELRTEIDLVRFRSSVNTLGR